MKLRKLEDKDALCMYEWMNDKDITSIFNHDFSNNTIDDCLSFIHDKSHNNLHMAIVDDCDEYMGTVSLKNITKKDAEFAIVTRRKVHGKGYASFGMKEIMNIGFNTYNLEYIYWNVLKDNKRAIKFYDKNGYKRIDINDYKDIGGGYLHKDSYYWYLLSKKEFK